MDPLDRCVNSWSCSITKLKFITKDCLKSLPTTSSQLLIWSSYPVSNRLCWIYFIRWKLIVLLTMIFSVWIFFQNPSNCLASNLGWLHFPPVFPPNLWGRPSGCTYSGQTAKQHLAELLDLWKKHASFGGPGDFVGRIKKKLQGGVSNVHGKCWWFASQMAWKSCEQYCFHDMICMYIYSMSFNTKTLWTYFLLGRFWYRRFDTLWYIWYRISHWKAFKLNGAKNLWKFRFGPSKIK